MLTIRFNFEEFHLVIRTLRAAVEDGAHPVPFLKLVAACRLAGCSAWIDPEEFAEANLALLASELHIELSLNTWLQTVHLLNRSFDLTTDTAGSLDHITVFRIRSRITDEITYRRLETGAAA